MQCQEIHLLYVKEHGDFNDRSEQRPIFGRQNSYRLHLIIASFCSLFVVIDNNAQAQKVPNERTQQPLSYLLVQAAHVNSNKRVMLARLCYLETCYMK